MTEENDSAAPGDRPERAAVERVHGQFLAHIDVIRGFIRALVRDPHLADDVLQETFLTVARKAEDFEPGTNFPKWACAVARLKVLEARRRDSAHLSFLSAETIEALAAERVEDLGAGAVDELRVGLVEACIDELPPSMRRMVDLRYLVGRKPAQIASQVGWTVDAVYVCLSRARGLLRDCVRAKLRSLGDSA